ncbi:hypothetical protein M3Y97_00182600 [Aphelenchoides bicaudatus]|nr:hypothetical protein M3Y97_00182600 [Aphelenchoides bicaudatus]
MGRRVQRSKYKLDPSLQKAFTGHFLRRQVLRIQPKILKKNIYLKSIEKQKDDDAQYSNLRQKRSANTLGIDENRYSNSTKKDLKSVDITLPHWFFTKRLKFDADLHCITTIRWPMEVARLFLEITTPEDVKLFIWSDPLANKLLTLYIFSEILYNDELGDPDPEKMWKDNKWLATCLVLRKNVPNLSAFSKFNEVISRQITELFIPFEDINYALHLGVIKTFRSNVDLLKKRFPNLRTITATYQMQLYKKCVGDFIEKLLYQQIEYLVNTFNNSLRPQWCKKLNILIKNYIIVGGEDFCFDFNLMSAMQQEVKKCRSKLNLLEGISLRGAVVPTFDWFNWRPCSAMIEMKTEVANFQIMFKTHNNFFEQD